MRRTRTSNLCPECGKHYDKIKPIVGYPQFVCEDGHKWFPTPYVVDVIEEDSDERTDKTP